MTENPLDIWYSTDKKLQEIIVNLSNSGKSAFDQARDAFYQLSDIYTLPKYPADISEGDYKKYEEEGIDNPRTVFEEVGILRYLELDDDPHGVVLCALYNIKNKTYIDINICAERHFGGKRNIPHSYMIYYTGQDADGKLNFLNEGEQWSKDGVKYASKIVNQKRKMKTQQR